jgi:hypothetical protein
VAPKPKVTGSSPVGDTSRNLRRNATLRYLVTCDSPASRTTRKKQTVLNGSVGAVLIRPVVAEEEQPALVLDASCQQVETKGLEPSTPALQRQQPTIASDADKGVTASDSTVCPSVCPNLDDLAKIVAAWPHLPEPVRRAMLALVS